jgi:BMFP domain-containing protein YqiC
MNSGTGTGGGAGAPGGSPGGSGAGGAGGGGPGGAKRGLFDDLAGMAGGAFSVLAGARQEAEAMARAQVEAMVQRFELVRRDDLDAALEVARRAREQCEALEARVAALEARLAPPAEAPDATPQPDSGPSADGG